MALAPVRLAFIAASTAALLASSPAWSAKATADYESAATSSAVLSPEDGDGLKPGAYIWRPELSMVGEVSIVVDIPQQMAYVYRGGTLIGLSTVSTGRDGHETPVGSFQILEKQVKHRSTLYDSAPMPYMERLTWDGVALHAGGVPGYRESHGCVHLPDAFAKALFAVTDVGASVQIRGATDDAAPADMAAGSSTASADTTTARPMTTASAATAMSRTADPALQKVAFNSRDDVAN